MSQTLHQIYQNKAIVLAKTTVIKFHRIALAINDGLRANGYTIVEERPETWKYYMNMSGEYHQSDMDALMSATGHPYMRIKVAGDAGPIEVDFTKESMSTDTGDNEVANEYRFDTAYYNALVAKYPDHEDLLLGILNPINLNVALDSADGDVLFCGGYVKTQMADGSYHYIRREYGILEHNYLIEKNEENLIPLLQERLNLTINRWWNVNYALTANLYHATFMVILYLNIPQILNYLRIANAKTPMVHSFHVREHLDSVGSIGWVVDHLSQGVLLWIYRNLIWLDRNKGRQRTFDEIVDNVLIPENVPLASYNLRHDVSDVSIHDLLSEPYMERTTLRSPNRPRKEEILEVVEKQAKLAKYNYLDQAGQARQTEQSSKFSMYDKVTTKVLESTMIDRSKMVPYTMEDIALNMWLYCASSKQYQGTVIYTNPVDNTRLQITPLNAYILTMYCLNKGWANVDLEYIPTPKARLVHRHPQIRPNSELGFMPKLPDLLEGTLLEHVTVTDLTRVMGKYIPNYTHRSPMSFSKECQRAFKEANRKYMATCRITDARGRGMAAWASKKCYWNYFDCELAAPGTKYSDWLVLVGLDLSNYSDVDLVNLASATITAALGQDVNLSGALRDKQSAALAVLKHFSSYTIQIIQTMLAQESFWLDWRNLRITNIGVDTESYSKVRLPRLIVDSEWSIHDLDWHLNYFTARNIRLTKEMVTSFHRVSPGNLTLKGPSEYTKGRVRQHRISCIRANIPSII